MFGLEDLLVQELETLGVDNIQKGRRIVHCEGDWKTVYRCNLELRTALRVLIPLTKGTVNKVDDLYDLAAATDWTPYLEPGGTLMIDQQVRSDLFRDTRFAAYKVKDAICDVYREKFNRRPTVEFKNPQLRAYIYLNGTECEISVDSSGNSLHKRGYRIQTNAAPLNEVLAAGMIMMSGWDQKQDFINPMCGSGTLLVEAGMMAANISPGRFRDNFGFQQWENFRSVWWRQIKEESREKEGEISARMVGFDVNKVAIQMSGNHLRRAGVGSKVELHQIAIEDFDPKCESGTVIINPPYNFRMEKDNILDFYKMIGDNLKTKYQGTTAWIISANMEAIKSVGLKPTQRNVLFNGPNEARYNRYDLYAGTKRKVRRIPSTDPQV